MTNRLGRINPKREVVALLIRQGWTAEDILRQSGYEGAELERLKLHLTALQNELKYGGKDAYRTTLMLMASKEKQS